MISCGTDCTIILWDAKRNCFLFKKENAHEEYISEIVVYKSGQRLISISADRKVKTWMICVNRLVFMHEYQSAH
jgi:WD40 repeat protein